jgi:hypothetical protein
MTTFAPAMLPDQVKEGLCLELLAEFGAAGVRVSRHSGEIHVRCILPWHEDRSPSASLNYQKLVYNCFSCQSSGGLLWLISTCRGLPEHHARTWLEGKSGTGREFDLGALLSILDALAKVEHRRPAPIPQMSLRAIRPWMLIHPYLTDPRDATPPGRAVPRGNVERLLLGYAERYPVDDTGRTSERIIIPHLWRGELVGWQSRRLWPDGTPKYLSTEEFPRDRTIYALDCVDPAGPVVVVESPMSTARHIHHLPMVATFGAEVTAAQIRLLARHPRVVWWMDNDPAGWKATAGWEEGDGRRRRWHPGGPERLAPYTDVWVVSSPWAADPADMDDDTAAGLVSDAVPYPVWRQPTELRCWLCREVHPGRCP